MTCTVLLFETQKQRVEGVFWKPLALFCLDLLVFSESLEVSCDVLSTFVVLA